jgi:hypothetical protein
LWRNHNIPWHGVVQLLDGVAVGVVVGGEVLAEVVEVDGGEGRQEAEGGEVGGAGWGVGGRVRRRTIRIWIWSRKRIAMGWGAALGAHWAVEVAGEVEEDSGRHEGV